MSTNCYHEYVLVPSTAKYAYDALCKKCNLRVIGGGDLLAFYFYRNKILTEPLKLVSGFEAINEIKKNNKINIPGKVFEMTFTKQDMLFAKEWWEMGEHI